MVKLPALRFYRNRLIAMCYVIGIGFGITFLLVAGDAEMLLVMYMVLILYAIAKMAYDIIPSMDRTSLANEYKRRGGKPFKVWAPGNYAVKVKSYGYWYQTNSDKEYYLVWVRKPTRSGFTFVKDLYFFEKNAENMEDNLLNLAAVSTTAAKEFISKFETDGRLTRYDAEKYADCVKNMSQVKELVENCVQK